ncbi:MAG: isocitrate lyase/PEP mutase family protein [Verrucomicrobiae bacterium]|nr:isocitrate lyase/PEP mutase family protein [Verrucomicrobiae bacterium]MDW8309687.1 isocitrate lyase/PEP mutase family protein [Verrucomicrobiales bacterium]
MNTDSRAAQTAGARLRAAVQERDLLPFIGVYDVFSATLAARHFDALFVSGFGFAASHYGLPDIGFITWSDIVNYVQRIRTVLPEHHLLVDIDDGYCDTEVACHVVSLLEASGASGVVLEDQKRPRRCGHFEGKQLMELDEYLAKLRQVLATRHDLFVIARTDSSDPHDIQRRVMAFAEAGADAVLVDGLKNLETVRQLSALVRVPFCFNQIAGGKSLPCTFTELRQAGARLVIYSTPCLFAAQPAIDDALQALKRNDGSLAGSRVGVKECTQVLQENLSRRRAPQVIPHA